jgi:hypothetical protein
VALLAVAFQAEVCLRAWLRELERLADDVQMIMSALPVAAE